MPFTVRNLLNLEVLKGLEVVAGHSGIDKIIKHITVLDSPDGIKWLKGNEFVVTNLYSFKNSDNQLSLIQELSQRNSTALGIKLNRFVSTMSDEVIELANKNSFPLISIPYEKAWVDLINPVMAELLNRQLVMLKKSNSIRHLFIDEVLKGRTLSSIGKILSELTESAVTILELKNMTIYTWPNNFNHNIKSRDLYFLQNSANKSGLEIIYSSIGNTEGTVLPVEIARNIEGYIIIWKKDLREIDQIAVEHATTVVALCIQQLMAVNETNQRFLDDFLKQLLKGELSDSYVREQAGELGWEINSGNIVVTVRAKYMDPSKDTFFKSYDIFKYFKSFLHAHNFKLLMGMNEKDTIIFLIPCDGLCSDNIIKTIIDAKERLINENKKLRIAVGIGKNYESIDKIPLSYKEASIACKVSMALNQDCKYSEIGVYSLLVELLDFAETDDYLDRLIYPIVDYDEKNNSEIFQTLETFINFNSNYRETARAMFVHHNTIRYRLKLAEKIIGLDLQSPQTILSLMLGIKLFYLKNS